MKRVIISIFCVLLGIAGLAGETWLLLNTRKMYVSAHRQEYSEELKDATLQASASIRMGEMEKYKEAIAKFDEAYDKITPYLEASEKAKLENYREALGASETKNLLKLNAVLQKFNTNLKEPQDIDVEFSDSELDKKLSKLKETLKRYQSCEVYCSAKDYREIEADLTSVSDYLEVVLGEKEQASASRLGSEEMIEWLDMLK